MKENCENHQQVITSNTEENVQDVNQLDISAERVKDQIQERIEMIKPDQLTSSNYIINTNNKDNLTFHDSDGRNFYEFYF